MLRRFSKKKKKEKEELVSYFYIRNFIIFMTRLLLFSVSSRFISRSNDRNESIISPAVFHAIINDYACHRIIGSVAVSRVLSGDSMRLHSAVPPSFSFKEALLAFLRHFCARIRSFSSTALLLFYLFLSLTNFWDISIGKVNNCDNTIFPVRYSKHREEDSR